MDAVARLFIHKALKSCQFFRECIGCAQLDPWSAVKPMDGRHRKAAQSDYQPSSRRYGMPENRSFSWLLDLVAAEFVLA
ncbi:MAG TPA: hypothetical protein VKB78_09350 [Pirellulales bacterium]|nr:hypothetical protein [Pirellulales bacterium]